MLNIGDFAFDTTTGTSVQVLEKIDVRGYVSYKVFNPAAGHIGIENIRASRLRKLAREKAGIEEAHRAGSRIYPDFKLSILIRLEV